MPAGLEPRLDAARAGLAQAAGAEGLALAVSGGGDSMALLALAAEAGIAAEVITVDHGLRDVTDEIALVARAAAKAGFGHHVLRWAWDGHGNLQDAARQARKTLIGGWAQGAGLGAVALAHSADDQAETLLMRLARGSGVDGLAGMSAQHHDAAGLLWLRPLLALGRDELRGWLATRGHDWADDPSNDDPRFDRIKARQMQGALADLGLTRTRLLRLADHMEAARLSLDARAAEWVAQHVRQEQGDLLLPAEALRLEAGDTPRRVLAAALGWVGGSPYRPRYESLQGFAHTLAAGQSATLQGCLGLPTGDGVRLCREEAALDPAPVPAAAGMIWDHRWRLTAPPDALASARADLVVAPLGDSLTACPDWRETGLPRQSLRASPGLWRGPDLVAAPLAGFGTWQARIVADFSRTLLRR